MSLIQRCFPNLFRRRINVDFPTSIRFAFSNLFRRRFNVDCPTSFQRRFPDVDSICVFEPFSTSFRRHPATSFQRRYSDVISTSISQRRFDLLKLALRRCDAYLVGSMVDVDGVFATISGVILPSLAKKHTFQGIQNCKREGLTKSL